MSKSIDLYTIGFTKKTAERFFTLLRDAGIKTLMDTRLNNSSQLAGFAKREDLAFFLKEICNIEYQQVPQFAPTQDLLDAFKKQKGDWKIYEEQFGKLIRERKIENLFPAERYHQACLLCSEDTPEHCHRRLVAEYLKKHKPNLQITHLM